MNGDWNGRPFQDPTEISPPLQSKSYFSHETNSLGPVQHLRVVSVSGKELNFTRQATVTIKGSWRQREEYGGFGTVDHRFFFRSFC